MSSRSIRFWIAAVAIAIGSAATAQADTITDGDSSFDLRDIPWSKRSDSANGDFSPNGSGNTIYETWWWYRLPGDTDENIFYDPISETFAGNQATFEFALPAFHATLTFTLIDGELPMLIQDMTITNTGQDPLEIDLFHYLDVRLGEDHTNDTADLVGTNRIRILSPDGVPALVYEAPDADDYLATDNDSRHDIEKLFRDDQPTEFDSSGLPFTLGDGNFNAGFQFRLTILAGQSYTASTNVSVNPEPTSTVLVGAGLVGLAWWRRRRKRKLAA